MWELLLAFKMELGLQRKPVNLSQRDSEGATNTHLSYWSIQNTTANKCQLSLLLLKSPIHSAESISGNNNANKKKVSLMKNS